VRDGGFDLIETGDIHLQRQGTPAERTDLVSGPIIS
jgi:hypothetical protein